MSGRRRRPRRRRRRDIERLERREGPEEEEEAEEERPGCWAAMLPLPREDSAEVLRATFLRLCCPAAANFGGIQASLHG